MEMTEEQKMEKKARFDMMKNLAVERLGEICGEKTNVKNDLMSIIAVKSKAEKCGEPMEKAWVDYFTNMWTWAHYEEMYHGVMPVG